MRRAMDCACGQHLEAANDEELFREGRKHVQEVHPEMQMTDEELRAAMAPQIYDVEETSAS
jgi:predicted small metal-binding protein